jgi:hypothetical protein
MRFFVVLRICANNISRKVRGKLIIKNSGGEELLKVQGVSNEEDNNTGDGIADRN